MANALATESSPYLRQHASNPVQWMPWGEQALQRAVKLNRPLLVSIGYSACHWCHVMERESFTDEDVAALMNESFVCVKVDREERPDIDALYIEAVQAMTGQGGWPLNVFLTPEQLPFYGGTYFPPQRGRGMPSWTEVLEGVAEAWSQREQEIRRSAESMRARLAGGALLEASDGQLEAGRLPSAAPRLYARFDQVHGGFGGAPKFPEATVIELLLAEVALGGEHASTAAEMAIGTLGAIVDGGIHDLVGGGFHRYAVDATWTVPHFEKMLYDNALLAKACLRGFKLSGEARLLQACLDTVAWARREMLGDEGAFCSALDADSAGVEGAYYVWSVRELREVLRDDFEAAIAWTGASEQGNFRDPHHPVAGLNVLSASGGQPPQPAVAERIKAALAQARARRQRPALDEKRLTSWNALMIAALAETGAYLKSVREPDEAARQQGGARGEGDHLLAVARRCAEVVYGTMRDEQGRLLRTYSDGRASVLAFLEDYAFSVEGLLSLYEATFEERWLTHAQELAEQMIARFHDEQAGGFFSTAADATPLIARRKELQDSPIPSGASSAALGLLRLTAFTGQRRYEQHAESTLKLLVEIAQEHPSAFGHALQALRLYVSGIVEVAIVGRSGAARDALVRVVRERHRPNVALACGDGSGQSAVPLLKGRTAVDGAPAAYVCEHFSCRYPVTDASQLSALLDERTQHA